jgi:hypothetical protein
MKQPLFKIGDSVWDTLTLRKTKIIGIEQKLGKKCCFDIEENITKYYVDDHMCQTYRLEEELIRGD